MRRALLLLGTVAVLGVVNGGAFLNERLLRDGRLVLLELAPRDPRSIMQGDYMTLRFTVTGDVYGALADLADGRGGTDGIGAIRRMVLAVDANGVGRFARLDDGRPLGADESWLAFRSERNRVRLASDAWFFEEGTAARYEAARYGGFRIAPDGRALLASVHDEDRVAIEPPSRTDRERR